MTAPSRTERLCRLASAIGARVTAAQAGALLAYLDAMLDENRAVNLTSVRDPEQALVLHALDSLAVERAVALEGAPPHCAIDLGSGNGFPGVAVSVLWPGARVVLLDRTAKKLRAVERALARAGIDGVTTVHVDAAQIRARAAELCGTADLVTARAFGEPDEVARMATPLLASGGSLVLWTTATATPPARAARLRRAARVDYELPEPAPRRRRLAVYRASP